MSSATLVVSPWQINVRPVSEIVTLPSPLPVHGDASAYQYKNIPLENDPSWNLWTPDASGRYSFSQPSRLTTSIGGTPQARTQLDFLYIQSFVDIPGDFNLQDFRVTFDAVDDGARVYVFNSAHPDGGFDPKTDLKLGGKQATDNLKSLAKVGERNRVVVVQFDDQRSGNAFTNLQIKVNCAAIPVKIPDAKLLKTIEANASSTHRDHTTNWLLDTSDRPVMVNGRYTFWNSVDRSGQGSKVINEWVWVKAESPANITQIKIHWARARAVEYTVWVSNDGVNWHPTGLSQQDAKTREDGQEGSVDEISCNNLRCQWVKIDMTRAAGNYEYYSCYYIALSGIA